MPFRCFANIMAERKGVVMTAVTSRKTSFIVTSMGHRFKFTPEDLGYSVSELGVKGVNTQGDIFEEALANALEASRVMGEFIEELQAEKKK